MTKDVKHIFSKVIGLVASDGDPLPNIADRSSGESIRIARAITSRLGDPILEGSVAQTKGHSFETAVRDFIEARMRPDARVRLHESQVDIDRFDQYRHLARLDEATETSPLLRATMAGDHRIRPDIVISRPSPESPADQLVASISCKITLRSDRAQNARSEALNLLRLRSGPAPRICLVTAEPLPSRLESVARGTGDLDHVFHVALEPLIEATAGDATPIPGLVEAGRLKPIEYLIPYLGLE